MILFFYLLPMLIGMGGAHEAAPRVRSAFVQDELVVRVPVRPMPDLPSFEWDERKGPKCLELKTVRGALLSGDANVDFVMEKGRRVRAKLDSTCPALDFYSGFYLTSKDGKVCVRRDEVRSRMGGGCSIERFRRLVRVPR